ncbi:Endoplasmin-like protein, partial [Bienertia sinuspersici]
IGMTKEDPIKNLRTIAKSGTSGTFVEKMQTSGDFNLIGQFRVEVINKNNQDK